MRRRPEVMNLGVAEEFYKRDSRKHGAVGLEVILKLVPGEFEISVYCFGICKRCDGQLL